MVVRQSMKNFSMRAKLQASSGFWNVWSLNLGPTPPKRSPPSTTPDASCGACGFRFSRCIDLSDDVRSLDSKFYPIVVDHKHVQFGKTWFPKRLMFNRSPLFHTILRFDHLFVPFSTQKSRKLPKKREEKDKLPKPLGQSIALPSQYPPSPEFL